MGVALRAGVAAKNRAGRGIPVWAQKPLCRDYSGTKNTNRAQTTTQAFYYVNHFHDHLLAAPIGFDEASRNFEFVNSSGQGLGGDPVEVVTNHHNFSLRNNASFQWATEGTSPILRTGMFDTPYDVNSRMEGPIRHPPGSAQQ